MRKLNFYNTFFMAYGLEGRQFAAVKFLYFIDNQNFMGISSSRKQLIIKIHIVRNYFQFPGKISKIGGVISSYFHDFSKDFQEISNYFQWISNRSQYEGGTFQFSEFPMFVKLNAPINF